MGTVYLSDDQIEGLLTCVELGREAIAAGSENEYLNSDVIAAISAESKLMLARKKRRSRSVSLAAVSANIPSTDRDRYDADVEVVLSSGGPSDD